MNDNIISNKYIMEDENSHYKSSQNNLIVRENNVENNVNFVFILSGPYRKELIHVFMNIIQP
jgi:hypothetical protein